MVLFWKRDSISFSLTLFFANLCIYQCPSCIGVDGDLLKDCTEHVLHLHLSLSSPRITRLIPSAGIFSCCSKLIFHKCYVIPCNRPNELACALTSVRPLSIVLSMHVNNHRSSGIIPVPSHPAMFGGSPPHSQVQNTLEGWVSCCWKHDWNFPSDTVRSGVVSHNSPSLSRDRLITYSVTHVMLPSFNLILLISPSVCFSCHPSHLCAWAVPHALSLFLGDTVALCDCGPSVQFLPSCLVLFAASAEYQSKSLLLDKKGSLPTPRLFNTFPIALQPDLYPEWRCKRNKDRE